MNVIPYSPAQATAWNEFIAQSKNGTFLFHRDYMDYHADRFQDASLMIQNERGELLAVFPANQKERKIISHGGLTYGGLIVGTEIGLPQFLEAFTALIKHLKLAACETLEYKTVPAIFHTYPAEEEKYALFLINAELYRRDLASVIIPTKRLPLRKGRKSDLSKAIRHQLRVEESTAWETFWEILHANLHAKHGVKPVHTLPEIVMLQKRFPENIQLFTVHDSTQIVAGTVIYETPQVAHTQYIGCTEAGRKNGALDLLLAHLLEKVFAAKPYFNFGTSTTNDGRFLNRGLVDFKESFGARTVAQDFYRINLTTADLNELKAEKEHD